MGAEVLIPILGSIAGAVVSKAITPKPQQQQQAAPPAPEPAPAPQATKNPVTPALARKANAAAEGGGPNSPNNTLLTGPSGVSNDLLQLGRATLLGQ